MSRKDTEGIRKIAVKGFKSIVKECEIEIRPLTILAGANSSGKSSIMQPLLMLKQTLEAPYDPGPLLIDGPNVQFTEVEQFMSTVIKQEKMSRLQIQIETGNAESSNLIKTTYGKKDDKVQIIEMETVRISGSKQKQVSEFKLSPEEIMLQTESDSMLKKTGKNSVLHVVKRRRCFLYLETEDGRGELNLTPDHAYNIVKTIHLPGLRGNHERTYKLISPGPLFIGRFENYVASLIHEWQEKENRKLKTVVSALRKLKITGQVRTKKIGDAHIELQVNRLPNNRTKNNDLVSIADVGLGVSQVLPVIVALIAAEPGQLVYLEQPELHLHPNAQVALAQVLVDAAKRGVRVVAETHSYLLLLGVQTLVAEEKLSPDLVKLHWFSRNKEGITKVDSVDIDEAGRYGEWAVDFADVNLRTQSDYIKASQSRFIAE